MPARQFGRYEILGEIARGGMSTVYHAYDPRFRRDVALKILPREMFHKPEFRERFNREALAVAGLEHPAIVPVHDYGEEEGEAYLVMRLMRGGSLQERIRKQPLTVQEAARVLGPIARALDFAHKKGVIHRDIKPANILFDESNEPYLTDFGIVKLLVDDGSILTAEGGLLGTPAYMSPEQVQGLPLTGRSDIYAMGGVLFAMLTGKKPYESDTPMGLALKHVLEPTPDIRAVNAGLADSIQAIIQRAMAKSPDERYPTAVALADALLAAANDGPTHPSLPGDPAMAAAAAAAIAAANAAASAKAAVPTPAAKPAQPSPARTAPAGPRGGTVNLDSSEMQPTVDVDDNALPPAAGQPAREAPATAAAAASAAAAAAPPGGESAPPAAGSSGRLADQSTMQLSSPVERELPPGPPFRRRTGQLAGLIAILVLLLCVCGAVGIWQFVWLPEQERRNMSPEEVSRATRLAATFEAATARAEAVSEGDGTPAGPPTWTPRPALTATPAGEVLDATEAATDVSTTAPSATPTVTRPSVGSPTPTLTLIPTATRPPTFTPTIETTGPVLYVITVSTGCDFFDATDANVFIRLFGTLGESAALPLDLPDVNDFRECEFDSYLLNAPADLGAIESVEIWHDNTGFSAGWFLDWVNIRNNVTDEEWFFPCFRWLSAEEEDTSTFRRIFVDGPCE